MCIPIHSTVLRHEEPDGLEVRDGAREGGPLGIGVRPAGEHASDEPAATGGLIAQWTYGVVVERVNVSVFE